MAHDTIARGRAKRHVGRKWRTVTVDEELYLKLEKIATDQNISVALVLRKALQGLQTAV